MSQLTSDDNFTNLKAHIGEVIRKLREKSNLTVDERDRLLKQLESYECWNAYFSILQSSKTPSRYDYIAMARISQLTLENTAQAAEHLAQLIRNHKLSFLIFRVEVLPQILKSEDWATEATLLEAVLENFAQEKDKIACLERLCLIYEKKIHNDSKLQKSYERLLKAAPHNIKALRYFKLAYTQVGEWDQVAIILRDLLAHVSYPQEIFRYAQELAAILLYQLDRPADTIAVLEQYCNESPLDTSTIHFDAYRRLGDPNGCIRVLKHCLTSVKTEREKAILHYKIGEIELQLGQKPQALESLIKAARTFPGLLEAYEQIIYLQIQLGQWSQVCDSLAAMRKNIANDGERAKIAEAESRLKSALEKAR